MASIKRREVLAAGAILAATAASRKAGGAQAGAGDLRDLADVLVPVDPPEAPPEGVFLDAAGGEHRLSDFRGRGMVVNFWATWCRPCVAELPSLVALSRALAPRDIAVLTLATDRGGAPVVSAWLEERGISGLPVLIDPKGALARAWGTRGIPTTHVIGRDGRERARMEGAADWGTEGAVALIERLARG